jgi:integrase/recombinase XerD
MQTHTMNITIFTRTSRDKTKTWYYLEWGKDTGQRKATGIYTINEPVTKQQKDFNKRQLELLERTRSQMVVDMNAVSLGVTNTSLPKNFLDFYSSYVEANRIDGNRHLYNSLEVFKRFIDRSFIGASEITEELVTRFRTYLIRNYHGETPANYFSRFKQMLTAATKAGYFRVSPALNVKGKKNPSTPKDIVSEDEYIKLVQAPCSNDEVKRAFMFCLYTGLRFCDVKRITYKEVQGNVLRFSQKKTSVAVPVPLHPIAITLIGDMRNPSQKIFKLPTANGANKALQGWVKAAGINKHITWHSARHSVSVILQSNNVDTSTVAGILGHTSTKHVQETYRRYVVKNGQAAINKLPDPKLN